MGNVVCEGATAGPFAELRHRRSHGGCSPAAQRARQMPGHPTSARRQGYDGASRAVLPQRKGQCQ